MIAPVIVGGVLLFLWLSSGSSNEDSGVTNALPASTASSMSSMAYGTVGMIPRFESSEDSYRRSRVVAGIRASEVIALLDDLPPDQRSAAISAVVLGDPDLLRKSSGTAARGGYSDIAFVLGERADALELV